MPYLFREIEGVEARKKAAETAPFGPGFPTETAAQAERLEVWVSRFGDPGPDYCEFRLFDAQGGSLGTRRQPGY